jgi:uncharacterized metal-binding protein
MADCCCGSAKKRTVLLYACSGGANVAEISDKAARQLMFEGQGTMFCLAGIGASIGGMVQQAKDADVNLVIDGCPMDCAKKIFEKAGISNYAYIKVTDLGIDKVKSVRCTDEQVRKVVAKARDLLAASGANQP